MTDEKKEEVKNLTQLGMKPREIYSKSLMNDDEEESEGHEIVPIFKKKDFYNIKADIRRDSLGNFTPTQAMFNTLSKNDDFYVRHILDEHDRLSHLFFSQKSQHEFIKEYSDVVFIDATYKTNRYFLPLVIINGFTSINTSFYLAFAFVREEKTEDYTWVLNCLHELYVMLDVPDPSVAVTDADKALQNSLQIVMPNAKSILCIWHINKNIETHASVSFKDHSKDEADHTSQVKEFMANWNKIVSSLSLHDFKNNKDVLWQKYGGIHSQLLAYIKTTYLDAHSLQFVRYYIDQHPHFGQRANSRGEGSNSRLKEALRASTGDLKHVVDTIIQLITVQRKDYIGRIAEQKARASTIIRDNDFYSNIIFSIPSHPVKLMKPQYDKAVDTQGDLPACTQTFRMTMGLPCAHEIKQRRSGGGKLQLQDIAPRWRYNKPPQTRGWHVVSDDEELDPQLRIQEPIVGRNKGRPTGSTRPLGTRQQAVFDQSTRRDPSEFERQAQSTQDFFEQRTNITSTASTTASRVPERPAGAPTATRALQQPPRRRRRRGGASVQPQDNQDLPGGSYSVFQLQHASE